jgi:hypothetical protein
MSALPPKADINCWPRNVRFEPASATSDALISLSTKRKTAARRSLRHSMAPRKRSALCAYNVPGVFNNGATLGNHNIPIRHGLSEARTAEVQKIPTAGSTADEIVSGQSRDEAKEANCSGSTRCRAGANSEYLRRRRHIIMGRCSCRNNCRDRNRDQCGCANEFTHCTTPE